MKPTGAWLSLCMEASAVKDNKIWELKTKLRVVTGKMRSYRWRYFCVKYLRVSQGLGFAAHQYSRGAWDQIF